MNAQHMRAGVALGAIVAGALAIGAGAARGAPAGAATEWNLVAVDTLVDWCRTGPRLARVEGVDVREATPGGDSSFGVRP